MILENNDLRFFFLTFHEIEQEYTQNNSMNLDERIKSLS